MLVHVVMTLTPYPLDGPRAQGVLTLGGTLGIRGLALDTTYTITNATARMHIESSQLAKTWS